MTTRHLAIAVLLLSSPLALHAQGKGHGNGKPSGAAKGGHDGGQRGGHEGGQGNAVRVEHGRGNAVRVAPMAPQMTQRPAKVEHEQRKADHDAEKLAKRNENMVIHTGELRSLPPGIANARAHGGNARALGVESRTVGGEVVMPNAMPRAIMLVAPARGRPARTLAFDDVPVAVRPFILSRRPEERLAGKAIALALNNGANPNALLLEPMGRGVVIRNPAGVVLLGLDESTASNMGAWRVVNVNDRVSSGAPSFCRSGAGHPVFGRQWCLDKGFGLGTDNDIRWASTPLSNIAFVQPPTTEQLITTAVLRRVLGPTAFDRLATHAITLGLVDPLTATWLGQPTGGSRVLYVQSGSYPVAEFVDANRDGRPETLLVVTRPK